jgi:hypothetical protein
MLLLHLATLLSMLSQNLSQLPGLCDPPAEASHFQTTAGDSYSALGRAPPVGTPRHQAVFKAKMERSVMGSELGQLTPRDGSEMLMSTAAVSARARSRERRCDSNPGLDSAPEDWTARAGPAVAHCLDDCTYRHFATPPTSPPPTSPVAIGSGHGSFERAIAPQATATLCAWRWLPQQLARRTRS